MVGVKTFPIKLSGDMHEKLTGIAHDERKSLHQLVLDTLSEKVELSEKKK
jgi:predicted HicB family RNase H-like nuclease